MFLLAGKRFWLAMSNPPAGGNPMLPAITLSAEEQDDLRRLARRASGWVAERLHYVRLFARGHSVAEIAARYDVDPRTVSTWLAHYQEGGVAALADAPRSQGCSVLD